MKLDLQLGAQVSCKDQPSGTLVEFVVNPATQQVTDLVVQKGLLNKQTWVVPLTSVEQVTGNTIHLNLQSDQLSTYPEYQEVEVSEAATSASQSSASLAPALGGAAEPSAPMVEPRLRQGIVTEHTVISAKTAVRTPQGDTGAVAHLVIDAESSRIVQVVICKGFFPKHFIIPQEAIAQISADAILVTLNNDELAALPQVQKRRDEEIVADLQQRLQDGWPAFTGVLATCEAGSVRLIGYVRSKPLWYHAAELAQLVEGVTDVQNELIVDPVNAPSEDEVTVDLARQVHHALITDPRTATAVIDVVADHETVMLQGKVDNEEIRRSAEEIACRQPGVNAVDNRLTVAQAEAAPKLRYG